MVQDEYILERNAPTDNCDVRTPRKSLPGNLMPARQLRCVAPPLLPQLLPSTWSHVWPTQTTSAAAAWLTTERRALGQRKRERECQSFTVYAAVNGMVVLAIRNPAKSYVLSIISHNRVFIVPNFIVKSC